MQLSKRYEQVKFYGFTVNRAVEVLKSTVTPGGDWGEHLRVELDEEEWTIDSLSEWLMMYDRGCQSATLTVSQGDRRIHFRFWSQTTTIDVSGSVREEVLKVHRIFEEEAAKRNCAVISDSPRGCQKYEMRTRVPSISVSTEFLKEVESYFLSKLPSVYGMSKEEAIKAFGVKVYDEVGEHSLPSLVDSGLECLNDSVIRVSVELSIFRPRRALQLVVTEGRTTSSITAKFDGDDCVATAAHATAGLNGILSSYSTRAWLFHPTFGVSTAIWIVSFAGAMLSGVLFAQDHLMLSIVAYSPMLLFGIYSLLGRFVFPYNAFDTKRLRRRRAVAAWIGKGLAGALVFGGLVTWLRDWLLGN
jgi:hypothetical protein